MKNLKEIIETECAMLDCDECIGYDKLEICRFIDWTDEEIYEAMKANNRRLRHGE